VKLHGIHHITAIAGDPQRNLEFYTDLLGLRFVKRTVNFDDPGAYHFYFGDKVGTPGTILTFFPWPGARRGTRGTGQVVATSFAISEESLGYWVDRLKQAHVTVEHAGKRFGSEVLRFTDPDGLLLEMVTQQSFDAAVDPNYETPVPVEHRLCGFHAPSLELQRPTLTMQLLTDVFRFESVAEKNNRRRFSLDPAQPNKAVDVIENPTGSVGHIASGTVHHIAFRASTGAEQERWREKLAALGLDVTPIIDRQYFHSIYFREPGGILFEIATDAPGFAVDEPVDALGRTLKLPPQYEAHRSEIERILPRLELAEHSTNRVATAR
jgi:glyoxalase family protein